MKDHRYIVGQGFTLVELMVVISIIVLLVSIVMPSLNRARDIGRNGVCLTNLHGIGRAFQMYLNESNEILPKAASMPSEEPDTPGINILFKPYADSEEIFHCPGDRDDPTYFVREGTSYEYLLGALYEVDPAPTFEKNFLMDMVNKKISLAKIQVMYDFDKKFHGWTNILYADWHVDK